MTFSLSAADRTRLQHAQRVLLAPLEAAEPSTWYAAASTALQALADAQQGALLAADPTPVLLHATLAEDALAAYQQQHAAEDVATPRALQLGLGLSHVWDIVPRDELYRSRLYNEFARPHRMLDPFMLLARSVSGSAAWAILAYTSHLDEADVERRRALLELVQPAFHAGLASSSILAGRHARLAALVDAIPQPLLICDLAGRVLHQTPALTALLAAETAGAEVHAALLTTAAAIAGVLAPDSRTGAPPGPVARTAITPTATYRVSGCLVPEGVFGTEPVILVSADRGAPRPVSAEDLRERCGLTRREAEVALLLAERLTNREIAAALGISPHTAERHTERVLDKLGVASRIEVRARLALIAEVSG